MHCVQFIDTDWKYAENTCGLYVAFYKITGSKDCNIENLVFYNSRLDITVGSTINHFEENKIFCVFLADSDKSIPADSKERKKRAAEKFAILENEIFDKFPDLKGNTVLLDYLKPWSFERYTKTINGSAYGIKQTLKAIGFQNKVPIKGLYLVGQAIYPGFLGSMISSFDLACELFEMNDFWSRVKFNEIK